METDNKALLTLCRDAVEKWGINSQLGMVTEELLEILLAIRHVDRGKIRLEELAKELVDGEIVLTQLRLMLTDELGAEKMLELENSKLNKFRGYLYESKN